MMKSVCTLCAILMTPPMGGAALAQPVQEEVLSLTVEQAAAQIDLLCGTELDVRRAAALDGGACPPDEALLAATAAWVSATLDLPKVRDLPFVKLAPPDVLATIRFGNALPDHARQSAHGAVSLAHAHDDIVALYDDATQTIYLRQEWTGTPAGLSVLVHEMVHHMQNLGGATHECAEAREMPAFNAQARWLSRFGQSLEGEFSIDPITLFVRTTCLR